MNSRLLADVSDINPQVTKTYWGTVGGKPIWLYTLSLASRFQLKVTNYGAIVQSLMVPARNGKIIDVVLGYDSLACYIQDPFYMGAVVGRFCNRIDGGNIMIHGKRYQLSVKPEGFHQHGGAFGFNKKVWSAESFSTESSVGLVLAYTSEHLEEGFPGKLVVKVIYTLYDKTKWSIGYYATTDRATLINLTQHSYFNLKGQGNGNICDHYFQTPSPWYLPATTNQIPNGEIGSVKGTPFDFNTTTAIGDRIDSSNAQLLTSRGYDHYLVLEKGHSLALKSAGCLTDCEGLIKMDFATTEPGFQFYTGNYLSECISGKQSSIYHRRSGLCLETHHFPDAPNHPNFPSTVLLPGQVFNSKTEFSFSS